MTVEQFAVDYLNKNGMFENDAKTVVEFARTHELMEAMADSWQKPIEGYPEPMKIFLLISLRRIAVEWIEANQPEAWYKAVFVD